MDRVDGEESSAARKPGPGQVTLFVAMAGLAVLAVHMVSAASGGKVKGGLFETLPFALFWIHGAFFIRDPVLRWFLIGYAAFTSLVFAFCLDEFWSSHSRCGNSFDHWMLLAHVVAFGMVAFDVVYSIVRVVRKKE